MASSSKLALENFLKKHLYKKEGDLSITHTRIGDKKKIFGGAYSISEDQMSEFYKLYYHHIFTEKVPEYLTEKQNKVEGPILIDFDFRYNISVKKRKHNSGHIIDIIDLYTSKLKDMCKITTELFPIYVFEKPTPNIVETDNITKDGIHMIIGVNMSHQAQLYLRKLVLKEIGQVWSDLPIINSWESVLDEGISAGYTNWQLYGSRKPGNQAYQLMLAYDAKYDESDNEFEFIKKDLKQFDYEKEFCKLSAQYTDHHKFALSDNVMTEIKESEKKPKKLASKKKHTKLNIICNTDSLDFTKITDEQTLDSYIKVMLESVNALDYFIKESHDYVMILPEKYYEQGSYDKWIRVGWALHNTDDKLFLTWMKMSQKAKGFKFGDIGYYYDMWQNMPYKADGLTYKSIMYWAKNDAPKEEYEAIHTETVDYFISETIKGATEFDLANVLLQLYKDRYVCVSVRNNIWYEFKQHRWGEIDSGNTLRLSISKEMHQLYIEKIWDAIEHSKNLDDNDPNKEKIDKRTSILSDIAKMLKKTNHKNNIMREGRELFYDPNFLEKQDENSHLMCFKNGVFDFKEKLFRAGKPEDYITKSTNMNYTPIDKINKTHLAEVEKFIEQLFPVPALRNYMWNHLASTLIGTNENQTFNIYTGSGANGKSALVDLMSKVLGDYKGTVPITLITQKRQSIGGTSSEIVQLRGVRYAVMQEPSKGDKINEGIMKEITGGDPIQGRALFKETVTFVPQFKLVVCTNTLFDISDTGDGTWRRIRVCDFMSKFLNEPMEKDPDYDANHKYNFPKDKKLPLKYKNWEAPFMSKLVEIAKQNNGVVQDCDIVLCKSNAYREDQDHLSEFVKEKVEFREGGKIKKMEIYETFKQWFSLQYGRGAPKGKDLYQFMDKKFGKFTKGAWQNVCIIYETEEEDTEDI
jgi:P4 family phage/plasmid primase-like protien